jgi:hypothetical protein
MKQTLYTIFFVLVFLNITFPQRTLIAADITNNLSSEIVNQTYFVDTVFVHASTGEQRVMYSYNSAGTITETFTQKLNGTIWENYLRLSNVFDSNGNLLIYSQEIWQNDQWIILLRSTITYDLNGQAVQRLIQQNNANNQLVNSSLTTYTYDNNYIVSVIVQIWQNENWVNNLRTTYVNNSQGKHISELQEQWQNSTWENYQRFSSTYDGNSNLLSNLTEIWNDQWENGSRETNTYDGNNNALTLLYEDWKNGNWEGVFRNSYSYDASNNILQQTNEVYDFTEWRYKDRYTYSYDANENLISNLYEAWLNGQWSNWGFYGYTYDSNNNMLISIYQLWNNGSWENVWKQSYEYDANNDLTIGNYYSWLNSSWTPADGSLIFRDDGNNSFSFYGFKITVIYKNSPTYVDNEKVTPASYSLSQNYPNPFNPSTKISWQSPVGSHQLLKVYDVLGNEVATLVNEYRDAGTYEENWNAANLSSGVYFYRLQAGNFAEIKKMILIK